MENCYYSGLLMRSPHAASTDFWHALAKVTTNIMRFTAFVQEQKDVP